MNNNLSGCSTLAQTNYLARHNAALKILFFEMLKDQLGQVVQGSIKLILG